MNKQALIYSFVAKGAVVLAEHTAFSGNFSTVAVQCLQKLPPNSTRSTYSCDGHTFNFLVDHGFGNPAFSFPSPFPRGTVCGVQP
jgi:vesicle-associated membrane protein 72